jgi:hypothetical protein
MLAIIGTSGDDVKWLSKEFDGIMVHADDEVIRWCEGNDFDDVHVGIDKSGIVDKPHRNSSSVHLCGNSDIFSETTHPFRVNLIRSVNESHAGLDNFIIV